NKAWYMQPTRDGCGLPLPCVRSHLAWWPQSKIPEASQQATSGGHPHAACGVLCGLRSEGCKGTRMCSPRVSLPSCTSAQGGQQSGAQRAFCSLGPRQKALDAAPAVQPAKAASFHWGQWILRLGCAKRIDLK
ncbi:unnamed protein product, partial [Effrenium voratum]